jgi:pimeloyl-ACP methyl ester carboxylesterase
MLKSWIVTSHLLLNVKQYIIMTRLLISFILLFVTGSFQVTNAQTKNMKTQTGYADVNGIKMYYEILGEGKPLVLIHGGGSTIQTTFGRVLPLLAAKYKVIAVELQAHGHTSDRKAPETFQQDADDVAALLQQLGIAKAFFFGFSNGATTSLQIAIRHPELADKLVIASGAYQREGFIPGFFEGMQHASLANMPKPLQEAFLKINPDSNALLAMHHKDRDRMIAFPDYSDDDLRSIKAPALIINGDKDVVTNEHALKMSKLIPDAELMILPGEHGAYLGEICVAVPGSKLPELTVEAVEAFLDK